MYMLDYPWGKKKVERESWLRSKGLMKAWKFHKKEALSDGLSDIMSSKHASAKVLEDYKGSNTTTSDKSKASAPVREDWYWAFEHYGDDPKMLKRKDAPSAFAWSLLRGAWNSDGSWKSLQDKVAKELFGGDLSDDDDRAFIATGMPSALRERFSKVLGEAKRLLSGQLPEVFGRTEGS